VKAEYATYEDDDGVPVTCWYYRVKWHNYHLEDTILERPITWRMFGPRPNDMPISFWAELRRRQEVPPLKNPEKARTMKRELFRMRDEEDEREAAREKGESSSLNVIDKTEDEWEQLWADLGPEWEPDGALGAVYHAPIRVESKCNAIVRDVSGRTDLISSSSQTSGLSRLWKTTWVTSVIWRRFVTSARSPGTKINSPRSRANSRTSTYTSLTRRDGPKSHKMRSCN
jgi:hypothetical protein